MFCCKKNVCIAEHILEKDGKVKTFLFNCKNAYIGRRAGQVFASDAIMQLCFGRDYNRRTCIIILFYKVKNRFESLS